MSQKIPPNKLSSIYKIFRSCRLCGADEGYKMPIIQNLVELEDKEEIKQKIKECTKLEVTIDDKMPPLICELCVNKLNDFRAFKLLCKNTNNQTRTRLGLSPQNPSSSPLEKEQPPASNRSRRTRLPTTRDTEGSRPIKQQSSNRIVKNRKPVRSGSSTLKLITKKNTFKKREETELNNVEKAKEINAPLSEAPKKYKTNKNKDNSQNTTPEKQANIKIHETKSVHTESSSGKESIETNPREDNINNNKRNKVVNIYNSDKKYKCDFCTYSSDKSANCKRHERTHTGEKPFKCNVCEHRCTDGADLKKHTRTHTGEKPFKCNECGYRCTNCADLKKHTRTHTGEKPFKCNVCGYRCTTSDRLKIHIRTHTGEKPYKCNVCEHRCTTSDRLKIHIRTHTGEKPYKCNICKFRCTHSGNLMKHKRIHIKHT